MRVALGLWLLSCCVGSAGAAAQSPAPTQGALPVLPALEVGSLVALLPPAGTQATQATQAAVNGDNTSQEAVQTVTDALRDKGYRVLAPAQVSAQLSGHTPDGCRDAATCDPQLALATLEANAVVSIAVWQRTGLPSQVAIHVRRERSYGRAEIAVGSDGLRVATSKALSLALDDSRRTHEVVVRIESQPAGAKLRIDQTLSARTPARVLLLPGNHLVSVEAPGYVTSAQYLDVPEQPKGPLLVSMQLSRAEIAGPPGALAVSEVAAGRADPRDQRDQQYRDESEPSVWNYAIAVALFGTAVPLLTNAIYTATTRGDCVGEIDALNRCAERVVLGPAFYASVALASVAILAGTSFLIVRPLTSDATAAPRGAMLQWRRAF
jgi:hypothetical protein